MRPEFEPARLLQDYLSALSAQDIESIEDLCLSLTLLEIPFLKPNRLVGRAEIARAHRDIFASLQSLCFETRATLADDNHAIAEARLEINRRDGGVESFEVGIVAETADGELRRISLYGDARNFRPWVDRRIM